MSPTNAKEPAAPTRLETEELPRFNAYVEDGEPNLRLELQAYAWSGWIARARLAEVERANLTAIIAELVRVERALRANDGTWDDYQDHRSWSAAFEGEGMNVPVIVPVNRRERALWLAITLRASIAKQVRALRKARGYSQATLAERSGLRMLSICRIENEAGPWMSKRSLLLIANACDCALLCHFCGWDEYVNSLREFLPPEAFDYERVIHSIEPGNRTGDGNG